MIVDAGANIGLASACFSSRYPHSRIYALEPERSNFHLVECNAGRFRNVVPIRTALWAADGAVDLVDPGGGPWGFRTVDSGREGPVPFVESVPAMTVSTLLERHAIDFIDLLKVDIEGSELEVFADARGWIDRVGTVMIELHDAFRDGCRETFERAASAFPFRHERGEVLCVARRPFLL